MSGSPWAWALFSVYLIFTSYLAYLGGKKVSGGSDFAIGDGKMNPLVAGVTLGACLASSATFVIFPGFVYKDGLAALIGFSLPLIAGLATGFLLFSPPFQRVGEEVKALTVPHWIGARYQSDGLRRLYAGLTLLNVAYLVLVTVGCGYVMEAALGVPYEWSVVGIVVFVFGYTAFGGVYAHAFTNTMQGGVMLAMSLVIFFSGIELWQSGAVIAELKETGWTAPESLLYRNHWEVWGVPFLTGIALTTQPHLLTKALYVKNLREVYLTIGLGILTFALFCLVLFAGVYARITLPEGIPQDQVMARYLTQAFSSAPVGAAVAVAILAAAMSTMDGLLVAVSATVANDFLPGASQHEAAGGERRWFHGVWLNRLVLVVLAVLTIGISYSPPKVVLILGQQGVLGLVASAAGPLLAGLFLRGPLPASAAAASAVVALVIHFTLSVGGYVVNPSVSAIIAMAFSIPVALIGAKVMPVKTA